MTTTVNGTSVVFSDSTTQNTASDYVATQYAANGSWTAAKPGLKALRVTVVGAGALGGPAVGPGK